MDTRSFVAELLGCFFLFDEFRLFFDVTTLGCSVDNVVDVVVSDADVFSGDFFDVSIGCDVADDAVLHGRSTKEDRSCDLTSVLEKLFFLRHRRK
jgi:hypothetical protein